MKNIIKYIVLFCSILCVFTSSAQAIFHNTKIKDGSVVGSSTTPSPLAILELESTQKGLLLPRLTTEQRRNLDPGKYKNSSGLVIFNKDTDCIEYWNSKKESWVSLCGALPPADIVIDNSKCKDIHLSTADGKPLQSGKYLRTNDLLIVDVNVSSIGTYDIYAVSSNGYYFSTTGTFLRTGNIKVALQGVGTPIKGYDNESSGDILEFFINGKKVDNSCLFSSYVKKAAIDYSIICTGPFKAKGNYFIGSNFSQKENYVDIEVDVVQPGAYRIATEKKNGVSFSGSGVFNNNAIGRQQVRLYAEGIATKYGTISLKLETNSDSSALNDCFVEATVQSVSYSVDLTKAKLGVNPIKEGEKISDIHSIIIPVKVLAPGIVDLEINGLYDIKFAAKNVLLQMDKENDDIQYVTLLGVSGELPIAPQIVTLKNLKDSSIIGEYVLPIESQPISYSVNCDSKVVSGIFNPSLDLDDNNKVVLDVNVKFAGNYDIKTNTVNGVYFQATGKFENSQVGKNVSVTLYGKGVPAKTQSGAQYYISTNSSEADDKLCGFTIDFRYPDIQVLSIGSSSYVLSKNSNTSVGKMISSLENFGPNGKVKVNSIQMKSKRSFNDTEFKEILKTVDIVFLVYGAYLSGHSQIEELVHFVKNGGVVIYGVEDNLDKFKQFVTLLDPAMADYKSTSNYSMVNPVIDTGYADIVEGVFGSLKGKYLGNDYMNGVYFTDMRNIIPLARHKDYTQRIWAGMHQDYGFVFVGDGGWTSGSPNRTGGIAEPLKCDYKGNPTSNKKYGGIIIGEQDVYNSVFFMNIMDWAIKHVQLKRRK